MIIDDKEFLQLKKYLNEIFKNEICSKNSKEECPYCHKKNFIKFGKYNGVQRYKCKEKSCNRTFSAATNTLWYKSKKEPIKWVKYIELMFQRCTLRECSRKLEINIVTAFFWRQKILKSLIKVSSNQVLSDEVYLRKIVFKESYKGNPKAAREATEEATNYTYRKARENIWVVAASDSNKKIIEAPICKKNWDKNSFVKLIYNKLDKKCKIYSSIDRYLNAEATKHNGVSIPATNESKKFMLKYTMNILIKMKKFRGVATKYLQGYLYWMSLYSIGKKYNNISLFKTLFLEENYASWKDISSFKMNM